MYLYIQSTGDLFYNGVLMGRGYAGRDKGLNNPSMQCEHDIGPIPCGAYTIGDPVDGTPLGAMAFPLAPKTVSQMCNRGGFYAHADKRTGPPFQASHGCIVLSNPIRVQLKQQLISAPSDRILRVVAVPTPTT